MARAADPVHARSAAASIVSRLRDAGHLAYFAGGCVRDELLGLDPTDYDVATDATPDRVGHLFQRTMHVGAAFGVVLVPLPHATVEVATFRSDGPYSDARRPDLVHFSDPRSDALRRDFTINALFLDPLDSPDPAHPAVGRTGRPIRGRLIDYVAGLADLDAGIVRAVGDPDKRLAEDHLRALRAVRFAARLGFTLEPATGEAIRRRAMQLRGVSRERIGEEVRRMLLHPARATAAGLLQDLGLDAPVLDAPHLSIPLPILTGIGADTPGSGIPYATALAAWALDRTAESGLDAALPPPPPRGRRARRDADGLDRRWRDALCLSNDERHDLGAILAGYQILRSDWPGLGIAPQKRLAGSSWFMGALSLLKVREPLVASAITRRVHELAQSDGGIAPEPLVTGDDLVLIGQQPGPLFKRVIDLVYDAQLEGKVRSKEEALELAKGLCV